MQLMCSGTNELAFLRATLSRCGTLFLGAIFTAPTLAVNHATAVQGTTNDVIANPRQVLDPTTAHENHVVFLQRVTFARNVRRDFDTIR